MSEAGSGTAELGRRLRRDGGRCKIAAVVLWVLSLVALIGDIHDHLPRSVLVILSAAAATVTGIMVFLFVTAEVADEVAELRAKVGTWWEGYAAGAQDVGGGGRIVPLASRSEARPGAN